MVPLLMTAVCPLPSASPPTVQWKDMMCPAESRPPPAWNLPCRQGHRARRSQLPGPLVISSNPACPAAQPVIGPQPACAPRPGRRALRLASGGGGGWLQLWGNRCLLCSLTTSKKKTYHQHGVTEGAPEAPRSREVPCPGRSEARLETLSARWSGSRQPPRTLALRGSPSALWPSSAPGVQAPSLNSLLLPQGSPQAPSQLLLPSPLLLAPC